MKEKEKKVYSPAATAAALPAPAVALPPPRVKIIRNQPILSFFPSRLKSGTSVLAARKGPALPAYGG